MAQPRTQCLNTARYIIQRPLEIRAAFSTSAVARADDPSRMTVASGLLASLDGQTSSVSQPLSRPSHLEARSARPQTSKGPSTAPTRTGTERVGSMISGALSRQARQRQLLNAGRRPGQPSRTTVEELENAKRANDLSQQISRRWKAGDVYAPHDLSAEEMAKWKKRDQPKYDVFDLLGYDPLENYKNFSVLSEYMSPVGRIRSARATGLRPVNQRKIAKAIRRSIGMGMMPSIHRHPEILQNTASRQQQLSPARKGPSVF